MGCLSLLNIVLSGIGVCDGPIPGPEVLACSGIENSKMRGLGPKRGTVAPRGKMFHIREN